MPHLVWSDNARRDLLRLHDFIAEKNRPAARRASETILNGVRLLKANPELGRPVPERLPGYREQVIPFGQRAYVALYYFSGDEVVIVGVRHGLEERF